MGKETMHTVLRQAIQSSGVSAAELGRKTGISQPTITRFLAGADLRLSTAEILAAHFGLKLK